MAENHFVMKLYELWGDMEEVVCGTMDPRVGLIERSYLYEMSTVATARDSGMLV